MPTFTIEYEANKGEEALYRLCSNEEYGPLVGLGDVATLQLENDSNIYYTIIEEPEADEPTVFKIVQGKKVGTAVMEAVDNFDQDETQGPEIIEEDGIEPADAD